MNLNTNKMGLKIFKECCGNCLLSENTIVSPKRVKEIVKDCANNQTHFICHKSSMKDEEVVCKKYYDTLGYKSQLVRIAQRLGAIEFVEQTDLKKLPTYKEMNTKKTKQQ